MPVDLIVRPHNPRRRALLIILSMVLALVSAWGLFEYGRLSAGYDHLTTRVLQRDMLSEIQRLEDDNRRLRSELSLADRSGQVERRAYDEVRGTLGELNAEILRLREELAFYQGIVTPGDARRGLRIHSFQVEPTAEPRVFRFRMMLIQAMQHDRQATGEARIMLVGTEGGVTRRHPITGPDDASGGGMPFDFRYFQELEGDILLPEGLIPYRVEVALYAGNERTPRTEQVFDWPTRSQED